MSHPEKNNVDNPVIGITIGEINGISPEVIIKSLNDPRILNIITPVIYGSTKVLSYYRKALEANDFNYGQIKDFDQINSKRVNVVNCWDETIEISAGAPTPESGKCAYLALTEATKDLKEGKIDALVTGPISKKNIQSEEFKFPGHTEYLASELGGEPLMMMVSDIVKIAVVTGHISLAEVSKALTKQLIEKKLKELIKSLKRDFLVPKPKIAVLGLNPHAGEEGLLGSEEEKIISPAIDELKKKGNLIFGPFSADGFFGDNSYTRFDAILAMYHDQGLIPFKTLSFESGVNYTAGISGIRTSPDHGTGFSIAGKGIANESSMREAIYLAAEISKKRKEHLTEVEA